MAGRTYTIEGKYNKHKDKLFSFVVATAVVVVEIEERERKPKQVMYVSINDSNDTKWTQFEQIVWQ